MVEVEADAKIAEWEESLEPFALDPCIATWEEALEDATARTDLQTAEGSLRSEGAARAAEAAPATSDGGRKRRPRPGDASHASDARHARSEATRFVTANCT